MRDYPYYEQTDLREIQDLVDTQAVCTLLTFSGADEVSCGLFNPVQVGERFFLHLHRADAQVRDLKARKRAILVFQDVLAVIPSHWVDARYAGAATTYYRYAEFHAEARVIDEPGAMVEVMRRMMEKFQPEGGYEALVPESTLYRDSFGTICVVELTILQRRAKWKLGQNRSVEARRSIAQRLEARNQGNDRRAALEVKKWISKVRV